MKKLNLVVGVLVVAVLLLLAALLVWTFFAGDAVFEPDMSPAPTPPAPTATPPAPDSTVDVAPEPSADIPTTPERDPIEGEILVLEGFFGREKLAVTYSSELFAIMPTDIGYQFFLSSDSSSETFIEIVFIEDEIELRKASFLDPYLPDFTEMNMLGQVLVAGSSVAAEGLSATNGSKHAEAWLIDVEGGFFAVVAGYSSNSSKTELYRMLDTLTFSL